MSAARQVVLVPNPHYWRKGADGKPLPYLDKVVLKYVPESNSRVLGLQNGDFDAITRRAAQPGGSVKAMDGVTLEVSPSYRLDYVYLNHAKKPLDDKRIRLALNYAANREAIMKAVYFGYGEIPNSYMPKVNFWSDKVATIPYDIEKAKALVKEAGYDGTPIQLMVDTGNAPFRTDRDHPAAGLAAGRPQGRDRRVRRRHRLQHDAEGRLPGLCQLHHQRHQRRRRTGDASRPTAPARPRPSSRTTRTTR